MIDLQEEVSDKIATALGLELLPSETREWAAATTPQAYEAYLRGRTWMHDYDSEDPERHLRALREAVQLDAGFAPAWAALAEAYRRRPEPPTDSIPRAKEAVHRALSLDDSLPEAHLTLALIRLYYDWELEGARLAFQRALDLHPGYAEAWHGYAAYYSVTGDHEAALEAVLRARALDPLSPAVTSDVGWYSYFARRYDEAIERCRETLAGAPRFYWGHRCVIYAARQLGDTETARRQMVLEMEAREAPPAILAGVRDGTVDAAMKTYWRWDLERHRRYGETAYLSPSVLAAIHLARGAEEEAIELFEQAVAERSGWILPFLRVEPMADSLRNDPRFAAILEEIGDRGVLRGGL